MARKVSREDEDRALFKYVGAILDNTTERPRRRAWVRWLESRRALRFRRKLHILVRRHPLVPASLGLCCVVWICVANVMRSPPEEAVAAARPGRSKSLRVKDLEAPPLQEGEDPGATQADLARLRPLSYWLDLLRDPDWKVRTVAAFELVEQSRSSEVVLSALHLLLRDAHAGVRFWAVDRFRVLGIYEETVKSMIRAFAGSEELLDLHETSDTRMRRRLLLIVMSWLTDLDDQVRWTGLTVCGLLGADAGVLEPTLEAIAKSDLHEPYRRQASLILRKLPGVARER